MKRDKNGKWLKGETGNPNGRPKKEHEEEYYRILVSICTPAHWKKIVEKMIADAEGGDDKARKLLFDHALGLPVQKTELTGAEGDKIIFEVHYKDGNG